MELKKYQIEVLNDLSLFIDILNEKKNIKNAYKSFWETKGILVGSNGMPRYIENVPNVPHVCFKVPTGGGKTFIATSALKKIFDSLIITKRKVVVWLVPSDIILEQTLKNLKNPEHPYRARINSDFNSRVEIYTKQELLRGQNFNITSVNEQLSILVLSFDSLRSKNKEGRKVYQENSNLQQLADNLPKDGTRIEGSSENSLIQVINKLMPIIIVDESHNATSDLSIEMLINLNPSFILELTATPRENSNIISFVDALKLKESNMVKLPVIVYNRNSQQEVIVDAIDLRNKLEKQAISDRNLSKKYIRPIVLFQAQPKNSDDSTTFIELKNKLIKSGIRKEEIAIKTATVNEIKNIDLLSEECQIRYIITINALKEGWDCPFAYILATLANKTSQVDVEQIIGRILRQPYAQPNPSPFLNMSYVLTSSLDFQSTLENVVKGLNNAGFSKRDCRIAESVLNVAETTNVENTSKDFNGKQEQDLVDEGALEFNPDQVKTETNLRDEKKSQDLIKDQNLGQLLGSALREHTEYKTQAEEVKSSGTIYTGELRSLMDVSKVNEQFKTHIKDLKIPQFFINIDPNLFGETQILLTPEKLTEGFKLKDKALPTNLYSVNEKIYEVDIKPGEGSEPKYIRFNQRRMNEFKEILTMIPPESRLRVMENHIYEYLKSINYVDVLELKNYVHRIIDAMTNEKKGHLEDNLNAVSERIKNFIYDLIKTHKIQTFFNLLDKEVIFSIPSFELTTEINPVEKISSIGKSLYENEKNDLNSYEHEIISRVIALENILWWHRIIESKNAEFHINGFINHYPDFMVMTKKGNFILLEVKGEQLSNDDSAMKAKLGKKWQNLAGGKFRYYMVFRDKAIDEAITIDNLIDVISNL